MFADQLISRCPVAHGRLKLTKTEFSFQLYISNYLVTDCLRFLVKYTKSSLYLSNFEFLFKSIQSHTTFFLLGLKLNYKD